jgi:UDP-N-acetylglucosamine acyltransferase
MTLHKLTDIHSTAVLGKDVIVEGFTSIGAGVRIGDNVAIGTNVHIAANTVIGDDCRIHHGASIGGDPQIQGFDRGIQSSVEIGSGTVIREYVTVHRGGEEGNRTVIGQNCMLMNSTHVAHDCRLGDQVMMASNTLLAGHVSVEDQVFLSGLVGVHQFVRIGKHAMISGMTKIVQDVLPFSMVANNPVRLISTNSVGLKRSNIKPKVRAALKQAFKLICLPDLNTSEAVAKIRAEIELHDEIEYLINFINNSTRGVTK